MTAVDHAELKRVAEGARDRAALLGRLDAFSEVSDFLTALADGTCALLSEIEGLKAERDGLRAGINTLELERKRPGVRLVHLQRAVAVVAGAALRTQTPDSRRPDKEAVDALLRIRAVFQALDDNAPDETPVTLKAGDVATLLEVLADTLRPQTAESGT